MAITDMDWVETKVSRICLKDGIIRTQSKNTIYVSFEIGKENLRITKKLFKGVRYPVFMDTSNRTQSMSIPYLRYLAKTGHEYFTAAAVLVGTPTSKFIVQFFIKLFARNLKIPVKLVASEEEGIKWLQQFKT